MLNHGFNRVKIWPFLVGAALCLTGSQAQATFLGDLVFCDSNMNGIFDAGDFGMDGVGVNVSCVDSAGAACLDVDTSTGSIDGTAVPFLDLFPDFCGATTTWNPLDPTGDRSGRYLVEVFGSCDGNPGPWTCTVTVDESSLPPDCNMLVTPVAGGIPIDGNSDNDRCDPEDGPFPEGQPLGNDPNSGGCNASPDPAPGDGLHTTVITPGSDRCNLQDDFGYKFSPTGCRFTGGGVDTNLNWDHTLEDGSMVRNGAGNLPDGIDRYQFGGQAGANTALPPQPKGEWTHHQQTGPSGSFTFHGGTASAPPGTEIDEIRCSDPGWCSQARPAPAKQLDFDGVGTFKNLGKGSKSPGFAIANANVSAESKGNGGTGPTFHWFEVNIDDLGEPGRLNIGAPDSQTCPSAAFGEKGATPLADCDCPDFYRITIYDGVDEATLAASGPNRSDVIYEVSGFIDGGNLQIHPLTGFDRN